MFQYGFDPPLVQAIMRLTMLYVGYHFYKKTKKEGEPTWKAIGYAIGWGILAGLGIGIWLTI